jgi:predicted ATPase
MKDAAPGTLIFRRLRLENWRNFTQVDVDLQNRVFLVGPNASGKSNLLDVFRFLHDIVSVGGGFQEAAGPQRGGVTKLRSLSARRYPDIVIEVHIGSDALPNAWEYELRFSQDNQRRPIIRL